MMHTEDLESNLTRAAQVMGMLSNEVRLKILCILVSGELSVQAIVANVELSQPAVSHHLKKLRTANLVTTRRDKQTIYYSLHGDEVITIIETLHKIYCE